MNPKQMIPLVAAVGLGLVAMKIARDMSAKNHPAAASAVKTVQVVVAKGMITPGTAFSADQLDVQKIPGDTVPPQAMATIEEAVGRVALTPMFDGQPIRSDFLAPKGTPAGLAPLIPAGMRAITIDVNETSSVAGLLIPGSHVDVVSTLSTGDQNKPLARVVVQNVPVVAVGSRLSPVKADGDKPDQGYRTVTLLATPHDAELIELASTSARTRLVLRGVGDAAKSDEVGVSFVELLGKAHGADGETPPTPVAMNTPATKPSEPNLNIQHHIIQVIKAGAVNNVDFEMSVPSPNAMTSIDASAPAVQH